MSVDKVHGPEDAVVSEMIKKLLWEKISTLLRGVFSNASRVRWKLQVRGRFARPAF